MSVTRKHMKKGFALIEIILILTAQAILTVAVVVPNTTNAPNLARDTARKANINNLTVAIEMYLNDNGVYPGTTKNNKGLPECLNNDSITGKIIKDYLSGTIPSDPVKAGKIQYTQDFDCGITNTIDESSYFFTTLGNKDEKDNKVKGFMLGALMESNKGNNLSCFGQDSLLENCNETSDTGLDTKSTNGNAFISYSTL
ncbi:MAG: hypothetical protein UR27_C0013G0025 [Candidatus Peregrinibacteria bacterium GW2011_GWA2_33_10]|nr:MAG: hypothetical protein UR27_C0013G0025 [Candidatus Peregrinibacteria bacterium GW2011_GWA2_33_10]KKP39157.1 MAG: hypothetical protein UR30_C0012G0030 [Candidatus Peregrinibacteria bacterium GW2011_GWC2_33_13]